VTLAGGETRIALGLVIQASTCVEHRGGEAPGQHGGSLSWPLGAELDGELAEEDGIGDVAALQHGSQHAAALGPPRELVIGDVLRLPSKLLADVTVSPFPGRFHGPLVEQVPHPPAVGPDVILSPFDHVVQHMLKVGYPDGGCFFVLVGLKQLTALGEATGKDDLLAEIDTRVRVPEAVVVLSPVRFVGGAEVERQIAGADLAVPLHTGGVILEKVPLEFRLAAECTSRRPLRAVLGAERAAELAAGRVTGLL